MICPFCGGRVLSEWGDLKCVNCSRDPEAVIQRPVEAAPVQRKRKKTTFKPARGAAIALAPREAWL